MDGADSAAGDDKNSVDFGVWCPRGEWLSPPIDDPDQQLTRASLAQEARWAALVKAWLSPTMGRIVMAALPGHQNQGEMVMPQQGAPAGVLSGRRLTRRIRRRPPAVGPPPR